MAKEISDSQFKVEIEDHKGVAFVDFWAPWCAPCMMMAPIFEKVGKKFPQVKFCKVNTTENMQKASELGVTGIPCIIIFKDGKEVDRIVGLRQEGSLEEVVRKHSG